MIKRIIAGGALLGLSGAALAQEGSELRFETAMQCGVANAYIMGTISDDPDAMAEPDAAEIVANYEAEADGWFTIAQFLPDAQDGTDFDAMVVAKTNALRAEVEGLESEDEVAARLSTEVTRCAAIYDSNEAAIDAIFEALPEE